MSATPLARAMAAFQQNDYMAALTILNDLIGENADAGTTALLAETLEKLGLTAEAAEAFEQAARNGGPDSIGYLRRAAALHMLSGDEDQGLLIGMRLLALLPTDPDIAFLLAKAFRKNGELALVDRVKNILVESENPDHLHLAVELIGDDDTNPANLALFRKLAARSPEDPYTQFKYLSVARDFCDYEAIAAQEALIELETMRQGSGFLAGEPGYSNLLRCGDERLNRLATNNGLTTTAKLSRSMSVTTRLRNHVWGARLRIAYLSCDFWDDHATMRLFQSVLEMHDPERFDVTLYCHTPAEFIAFDKGNRQTWGRIVSIDGRTDTEAANLIRTAGTDILIDLKGHTAGSRGKILNAMVAPVQVAWLGFPGSTVNIDCDYVIGDDIVLPNSARSHYHEKFCRLPECYQPNDPVHRALPAAATRAALGLPEDRFVFAAFNAARKISLQTLDLWASILIQAPHSILWLMLDGALAQGNFVAAMQKRGVDRNRIIFAPKTHYAAHIARLQAADIGLDTFPYNGHTTTSDKLWAGLPVLTAKGSNFASRVSESLLSTLGLPELVTADHAAFVREAVALSTDPKRVAGLKAKLEENRFHAPLFDAERFCRHLETAYEMMVERAKRGLPPEHFDVPAQPKRTMPFR